MIINQQQLKLINKYHSGYALVTSMLLLLVLATMGVSMYGNVTVQEQMAFNMRVKARTFIAADSILQSNWTLGVLREKMESDVAQTDEPVPDIYSQGSNISIDGTIYICYVGESNDSPGFELNSAITHEIVIYKLQTFEATATTTETATHAVTALAQGGFVILPSADKKATCDTDRDGTVDQDDDCPHGGTLKVDLNGNEIIPKECG